MSTTNKDGSNPASVGAPVSSNIKPVSYASKAKIAPQTFYANERTFIQWTSAGLLLLTTAILLMDFGTVGADKTASALSALCVIIVIYALFVYYRRINLMENSDPSHFAEYLGPAILSIAIMAGIIATMFQYFGSHGAVNAVPQYQQALRIEADQCVMLGLGDRSTFDYQPSDILADTEMGVLIISSNEGITSISMDVKNPEVKTLFEMPDIGTVTINENYIFAMSNTEKISEIYALERIEGEDDLKMIGRWEITSVDVESMAYISGGSTYSPYGNKLIIAGETIDVYPLPPHEDGEKRTTFNSPVQSINKKMICHGLEENCKTGAIQFFEGHLYILHENDRVIRKWDLDSGQMLAEYALPWMDDGFEKQWTGMALTREESMNERDTETISLRKKTTQKSSLTLYLSLDTPAQIWSIAINENSEVWKIPPCASGS